MRRLSAGMVLILSFTLQPLVASSAQTGYVQRLDFATSSGLLGNVDGTDRSRDWAKYYGGGLAFIDTFANVGSTVVLRWQVTTPENKAASNIEVKFLVNKACSSSNGSIAPIADTKITSGTCVTDGGVIKSITDENGYVSIEIKNINSESEGESRPDSFTSVSTAKLKRYSQITLIIKNQLQESIDIVDIHWVKTKSDSTSTSTVQTNNLLWSQEFNSPKNAKIDSKYWNYDLGGNGWGNNELQNYQSDAVKMDGSGNLVITTNKLVNNKKSFCLYGYCKYSSARILTKGKLAFKYGKIEARIKMPKGSGTWPAFWMLGRNISETGWPKCGEIDIVEAVGNDPSWVSFALHGPEYSGGSNIGRSFINRDSLSSSFHRYGILWTPGEISWTFDGEVMQTVNKSFIGDKTWVFDTPQFILLNVAMGGTLGGEISPKFSSSKMYIDWLRVSTIGQYGELIRE